MGYKHYVYTDRTTGCQIRFETKRRFRILSLEHFNPKTRCLVRFDTPFSSSTASTYSDQDTGWEITFKPWPGGIRAEYFNSNTRIGVSCTPMADEEGVYFLKTFARRDPRKPPVIITDRNGRRLQIIAGMDLDDFTCVVLGERKKPKSRPTADLSDPLSSDFDFDLPAKGATALEVDKL